MVASAGNGGGGDGGDGGDDGLFNELHMNEIVLLSSLFLSG